MSNYSGYLSYAKLFMRTRSGGIIEELEVKGIAEMESLTREYRRVIEDGTKRKRVFLDVDADNVSLSHWVEEREYT